MVKIIKKFPLPKPRDTGVKQKVPIPIDPVNKIYAITTHSATQFECRWLFYHQIKMVQAAGDKDGNEQSSVVILNDFQQLKLDVSHYTLEKQLQRTAVCVVRFSGL
ncbi:competence protein ComK [Anaerobacillus sp. MEB173]|uniref:competence protein ComK n=1 Tax=Anaerobacillus sp. MEB173 TaxID=3383345 RepID=UPI003F92817A